MLDRVPDMHPSSGFAETRSSGGSNRRTLLMAGAGLLVVGGSAQVSSLNATEGPDAQLIAVCRAYDVLEERVHALNEPSNPAYIEDDWDRDDIVALIEAEQAPLVEYICLTKAVTLEGMRARVRSILVRLKAVDPDVDAAAVNGDCKERMVAAVLRDLAKVA